MTDATSHQPQAGPSSSGLADPPGTTGTGATGASDQPLDEEPLYVNAKQYYRILKRRVARARLEELHRLSRQRKVRSCLKLAFLSCFSLRYKGE